MKPSGTCGGGRAGRLAGLGLGAWVGTAWAPAAQACATCFGGQTNDRLAEGLNWGILTLLGVILVVLGWLAGFFVYLARRSSLPADPEPSAELPPAHLEERSCSYE